MADYLTVEGLAEILDVDEDEVRKLVRRAAPLGTVRTADRRWLVPTGALDEIRAALANPPSTRRGPRRALALTGERREQLLAEARAAADDIERAREAMSVAARRRQAAILALADGGLSVREIAAELGVSHGVVQAAIREARGR